MADEKDECSFVRCFKRCRIAECPDVSDTRPRRGLFIVLEGLDRSGKTTQAGKIAEALGAESLRFPDRKTAIGQAINAYLNGQIELDPRAAHLLFAANRHEIAATITSILNGGQHVVCDRYSYSGVAYSMQKGLSATFCADAEIGLPAPDLVFYLTLGPDAQTKRAGFGDERFDHVGIQTSIDSNFRAIFASPGVCRCVLVDAEADVVDVFEHIMTEIEDAIRTMGVSSIQTFGRNLTHV